MLYKLLLLFIKLLKITKLQDTLTIHIMALFVTILYLLQEYFRQRNYGNFLNVNKYICY